MTDTQRELARHALGLPNKKKTSNRNSFCIGKGGDGYDEWTAMVQSGLAVRRVGPHWGGDDMFYLTIKGAIEARDAKEHLSREDADCARKAEAAYGVEAMKLSDTPNLSLTDWLDERYRNAKRISNTKRGEEREGWLQDMNYFLMAREAAKHLTEAYSDQHANVPIRMHIALEILRAWNHGTEGYSMGITDTVNEWLDSGRVGPIPWPDSPFFAEWAKRKGLSKVGEYVAYKFEVEVNARS